MDLLLDTCTFLWLVLDPSRLSARAIALIQDPANHLDLSVVSTWEIALAYSMGRVQLNQPPHIFVPQQRVHHGIDFFPLSEETSLYLPHLPKLHRDPFDRMLVCQATVHDLTILTPDPLIRQYSVKTEW